MHELYEILSELSDRERHVMSQRLRTDTTEDITEIRDRLATEMQISRERIRQIELQAIRKLRSVAQKRKLINESVVN
jgi:DNA-directed RNA polymerase sigma subunit (sigma70/sigma32)